jgi:hypothetical protein
MSFFEENLFACEKYETLFFCFLYFASIIGILSGVGVGHNYLVNERRRTSSVGEKKLLSQV